MVEHHFKRGRKMMLFREYVELLYQAYLQDHGYLQTLRDKIKTEEFNKEQMYDPAFEGARSLNPFRNRDENPKLKYHPHPQDPQSGVFVYEDQEKARENWRIIKKVINRRKRYDQH